MYIAWVDIAMTVHFKFCSPNLDFRLGADSTPRYISKTPLAFNLLRPSCNFTITTATFGIVMGFVVQHKYKMLNIL